jgi:L-fucose isomerase-like protein
MANITVGVFSPNDPRPWVRAENTDMMIKYEKFLVDALKKKGVKVIRGGEGFKKEDQIAWNTQLVRAQAKKIAQADVDAIIINEGSWTFPYDSRDAVTAFANELKGIERGIPRVLIYAYKDTQVPGLVAGMAVGGALRRIGLPYQMVYGKIDKDRRVADEIIQILSFYKARKESASKANQAIDELKKQKYIAFGGMSLKMCTTTADVDYWAKHWGVSYEALDQSELKTRALELVKWTGTPGASNPNIKDKRVQDAIDYLYKGQHGTFDFSSRKFPSINKFIYQLSFYYAANDLFERYNATFGGIKCQDELSARDCTQCVATAFMNNDISPEGKPKTIYPMACENDMDSSMTQLWLHLVSGKPSGFGDFRDVEKGVLAIVNCGQHPPYYFGGSRENSKKKLDYAEYLGQEIFYDAGGASVRGRTPAGEVMTVARLARENLRYSLVATVLETVKVAKADHKKYNLSWPIIKGKLSITDEQMIEMWPCNHLGFVYGNYLPHLVEMAERLNIGYLIYDENGRKYAKIS